MYKYVKLGGLPCQHWASLWFWWQLGAGRRGRAVGFSGPSPWSRWRNEQELDQKLGLFSSMSGWASQLPCREGGRWHVTLLKLSLLCNQYGNVAEKTGEKKWKNDLDFKNVDLTLYWKSIVNRTGSDFYIDKSRFTWPKRTWQQCWRCSPLWRCEAFWSLSVWSQHHRGLMRHHLQPARRERSL